MRGISSEDTHSQTASKAENEVSTLSSNDFNQIVVGPEGLERQRRFYTEDLPSGIQLADLYIMAGPPPTLTTRLYTCNQLSDERPQVLKIEMPNTPPKVAEAGWPTSFEARAYDAGVMPRVLRPAKVTVLPTGKAVVKICG